MTKKDASGGGCFGVVACVVLLAFKACLSGLGVDSRASASSAIPVPAPQTVMASAAPSARYWSGRIISSPSRAEVWRDGVRLGRTPLDVELVQVGTTLEVRRRGYETQSVLIQEAAHPLSVDLNRQQRGKRNSDAPSQTTTPSTRAAPDAPASYSPRQSFGCAVRCCDGSCSPSCSYPHRGCCSHHGGVCG